MQSPAPTATVRVAQREDYTRMVFSFAGATTLVPVLQNNRLELRFSRGADIDIAELRAAPPRYVTEVRRLSAPGAPVRLALTLDLNTRLRHFVDGDRVIVDLLPPQQVQAPPAPQQQAGRLPQAPPPMIDTQPPSVRGNATVRLSEEADQTRITVSWPAAARAAAFRRGSAVYLLFDAAGQISLTGVPRAGRRHQDIEIVRGDNRHRPAHSGAAGCARLRRRAWFGLGISP